MMMLLPQPQCLSNKLGRVTDRGVLLGRAGSRHDGDVSTAESVEAAGSHDGEIK